MDPQSQRALIVVLVVGSIIVSIGTLTLFIIFRTYGEKKAGGTSHNALIAVLIAFATVVTAGPSVWRATVMAVAYTSDNSDDEIVSRWGGQRAMDR